MAKKKAKKKKVKKPASKKSKTTAAKKGKKGGRRSPPAAAPVFFKPEEPSLKQRKVQGISKSEIGPLRRVLLKLRDDLLGKVKSTTIDIDSTEVGDEADQASRSVEKELMFELSDNERQMLDHTEAALRKIVNHTFGRCEMCRNPIARPRIKALPWARYCIHCQGRAEASRF